MGADQRANPFADWKKSERVSQATAYDRNGRELQVGDTVHLIGKGDLMWRLTKAAPVLAPGAPAGLVELQLHAVCIIGVQGGAPTAGLLKTKDVSENPPLVVDPGAPHPNGGPVQ